MWALGLEREQGPVTVTQAVHSPWSTSPIIGLGIAGQTVNGPSTNPPRLRGGNVAFTAFD